MSNMEWQELMAAWSLLCHSNGANATEGVALIELAATRLRRAQMPDLAEWADEIAADFCPNDGAVQSLMARVSALAGAP